MNERLRFVGALRVEIISAGELPSTGGCLSVFAAAAGPLITGCLCVWAQRMLTLDELTLTLAMRAECYSTVTRTASFYTCYGDSSRVSSLKCR